MRKIYKGFDTRHNIEPTMWREILRIINEATVDGLSQGKDPVHEDDFLSALRHSNEVFAAMKTHQMGEDMAKKLLDSHGKLKPFAQWRNDVSSIARHHVGAWLKTEYNTAVIRAHAAADWREFERNKDILPNLRWMPTTSAEPDSAHKVYWQMKLTLPVDDPFWNNHHPGDRWNCKCSLEATDEPEIRPAELKYTKPQRGLESNPGKTAEMFSNTHPYYPNSCTSCPFNKGFKNKATSFFANEVKHCNECSKIDGHIPNNIKVIREQEYFEYKNNPLYKDVEFDRKSGGIKATHIEHNIDKKKGWYEESAQDVGYKNGHKVILEKEDHTILNKKNTEGTWDDMLFEIAASETATKNNIQRALKHCASKPNAEVAVLFFPNDNYTQENFEQGFAKFNGLKGTSQYRKFKVIYCLNKHKILQIKKPD